MAERPRIAIDAMGGDDGVVTMLAGAAGALAGDPALRFLLVGDRVALESGLAAHPALVTASEVRHAPDVIKANATLREAIRSAGTSSIGVMCAALEAGEVDAAVSGGNTRTLMPMAKRAVGMLPGIDRPALAAPWPSLGDNDFVMLDLGANTECDAENLVQFALMGAAYARIALDLPSPRVALLNIGDEEEKGTETLKEAAAALRSAADLPLRFVGYIEGDRLARGEVDVIVSDGFSGNIALKTAEGTVRFVTDLIRRAFSSSIRSRVGFMISKPATELLRNHLDPNNHNGAVFLGLNSLVVKSHGSATATGVANAIRVAAKLARDDLNRRIAEDLASFRAHPAAEAHVA